MNSKRWVVLILALWMITLFGCAPFPAGEPVQTLRVSTSSYPIYMLVQNAVRGVPDLTLTCLTQPSDDCLRAYTLSDWDAALLSREDVLVIGGRGLESFEAMVEGVAGGPVVVSAMQSLTLINDGQVASGEDSSHFAGENPWLFLSVDGAARMVEAIAQSMSALDPGNAQQYIDNAEDFGARIDALRREMGALIEPVSKEPVALLHEGLAYFAEEWSLNVVATMEREAATFYEDNELYDIVDALNVAGARAVLLERHAPMRLRDDLTKAGFIVVMIDTLTTSGSRGDIGAYEEAMLNNARALAEALQ